MTAVTPPSEPTGRTLAENLFYGALVVIGLIGAIAALIAATRPSDKGWTVVVGLVIAMIFAVTLAVGFYIWVLTAFIIPEFKKLIDRIQQDKASGLVPTLLATAQAIFIAATNELLNGDAALRWALAAILAALSLFGLIFATIHKSKGLTVIGIVMVLLSAGVVIAAAFTNHHWWSNYLSLSVGNQVAIAGAIGISIVMLIATPIVVLQKGSSA